MELQHRAFAGESDFDRVVELRRAFAASLPNAPAVSVADVRAAYLEPYHGWNRVIEIWELGDKLVGPAALIYPEEPEGDPVAYMPPRVHPDVDGAVVGSELITWAEAEAVARLGSGVTIEVTVPREAPDLVRAVESRGYRLDRLFERMERPAEPPVPARGAPKGYRVRPLAGDEEVDAWLRLYEASFQDHYDFHPLHRDARMQEMQRDTYLPELDLIASEPEGAFAAFSWTVRTEVDGADRWHVHYVGTARKHRRRGLASALLAETIDRINALGGGTIELWVDSTSETGANRVYERLGFRTASASLDFRRKLAE